MTDTTFDLSISRIIRAPRRAVWLAWSDPRHLQQWWCPAPWRAEVRAFDLRPGGAFDVLMLGPDGQQEPNPGAFLEIVPEERIVFTSSLTEGWRPATPWLAMTAIITMEDAADGTAYSARVLHKDEDDRRRHEELGFQDGWGIVIVQLEALARQLAAR